MSISPRCRGRLWVAALASAAALLGCQASPRTAATDESIAPAYSHRQHAPPPAVAPLGEALAGIGNPEPLPP